MAVIESRNIALIVLFGVAIFILKTILPFPVDKFLVVFQVLFLALGSLLISVLGATFVSLISGVLTAFWRVTTAPTIILFALIYGILVDGCIFLFKVKSSKGDVNRYRMIVSLIISSIITGLISYRTSVFLKLVYYDPMIEMATFMAGVINGAIAGYFVPNIWRKISRLYVNKKIE